MNELEREMPSLTPEEQQRIEAELARVRHEALEITTPPSPFRLDPTSVEVDSNEDGEESGASDDGGSLHSGYEGECKLKSSRNLFSLFQDHPECGVSFSLIVHHL